MSNPITQQKIEVIRNETNEGANTRGRVADVLTDLNNDSGGSGTIQEIIAGDFIRVDNTDPAKPKITALVGEEYVDKVLTIGTIEAISVDEIEISLHSSGFNSVRLGGNVYSVNDVSLFTFTQVTNPDYLKSLLIYALPDTTVFYMIQGVEGVEAVDPELPAGALLVRRIIVSAEGEEVQPPDVSGLRAKFVDSWLTIFINNENNYTVRLNKDSFHNFRVSGLSPSPKIGGVIMPSDLALYNGEPLMITNDTLYPIVVNNDSLPTPRSGDKIVRFDITESFEIAEGISQLFAYNPTSDKFEVVKFAGSGGGGGDFVPMAGTTSAKPFRGDLIMTSSNPQINAISDDGEFYLNADGISNLKTIISEDYYAALSAEFGITHRISGDTSKEVSINAENGINGDSYYGVFYNPTSYIQKKYVDDNFLNKVSATAQTITSPLTLNGQLTYNAPLTTDVTSVLVKTSTNQIKSATSVNIIDIWESSSYPTATQLSVNFPNAAMVMSPNTIVKRVYFRNGAFWTYVETNSILA